MRQVIEGVTEMLLSRNIKPSYQRIKVLEFLLNNRIHPTVDQIFTALQNDIPTLSKSTIYNTLNLFIDAGLVRLITIEENETRYDIDTSDHGHFKCIECGEIYDFSIDIDDLKAKGISNFEITDKNVYFRGVCSKCHKM